MEILGPAAFVAIYREHMGNSSSREMPCSNTSYSEPAWDTNFSRRFSLSWPASLEESGLAVTLQKFLGQSFSPRWPSGCKVEIPWQAACLQIFFCQQLLCGNSSIETPCITSFFRQALWPSCSSVWILQSANFCIESPWTPSSSMKTLCRASPALETFWTSSPQWKLSTPLSPLQRPPGSKASLKRLYLALQLPLETPWATSSSIETLQQQVPL